jgi:hypothetical protein
MNLKLGEDINGTFRTVGIGESLYTRISWIYFDCAAYYGYMGNTQIRVAALGTV